MDHPRNRLGGRIFHTGWMLFAALVLVGCSTPEFIKKWLPPRYDYRSYLLPAPEMEGREGYTIGKERDLTFERKGLRVVVRYLPDDQLNTQYPDISYQGEFSANPFTYGNWRDPNLGYTPNRFTVFSVEVHNPALPKVDLSPRKVMLITDRGEELRWYAPSREVGSENDFEDYYGMRRGNTGNERYRFDQRMGIVRERLYRPEHPVFKGWDYEGYIVFDPLDPAVKRVKMVIYDFVLEFDEFDHPSKRMDVEFEFTRRREIRGIEEG